MEVNGRPPRDCKGRDVWLEVNGRHKGSKADSERIPGIHWMAAGEIRWGKGRAVKIKGS